MSECGRVISVVGERVSGHDGEGCGAGRDRPAFCLRLGRRDAADLLLLSRADRAVTARHSGFLFASARQFFLESTRHARGGLGLREGSIMKVNYMLATAMVLAASFATVVAAETAVAPGAVQGGIDRKSVV